MPRAKNAAAPIDFDDPRPAYQQIANRIRAEIKTGTLAPGSQLLSNHELADEFGVAGETVKRAVRILQDEGLISARKGRGTFVRVRPDTPEDAASVFPQLQAIRDPLERGRQAGRLIGDFTAAVSRLKAVRRAAIREAHNDTGLPPSLLAKRLDMALIDVQNEVADQ